MFTLRPFIVEGEGIFQKEKAGMKETKVDSMVLAQKLNLSLSELLSENTSVFIKNNGRGALATASFRGTAPSHTQVTWNGMNINSPMLGMVDFSLIPVYIIDNLSLKHGTASITDKSGGLGGSINASNIVDWNKKYEVKYLQGIGSYQTYDEFLQIGGGNNTIHVKTRVYHNYSKNDYTFINHSKLEINPETGLMKNPLDTNDHAEFTRYGLLQELYYRPNKKNMLSVRYWGQYSDRSIPRVIADEGTDDYKNRNVDEDHKVLADWKYINAKSKLVFQTGYSGKQLDFTMKNASNAFIFSESTQNSYLNKLSYTFNFSDKFSVVSALDANYHDVLSRDSVSKMGFHKQRNEYSAMLALYKEYWKRLNLSLVLRSDRVDETFLPTTPFVGVDFKLLKKQDLIFKMNFARNYHLPSLSDMYWQPGGNPDLLPEEGYSVELGLAYQTTFNKHYFKAEATTYHSKIDNWIVWIPSYKGYWEPNNIKEVLSDGIEINVQLKGKFSKLDYCIIATYANTPTINRGDSLVWGDESYGKQLVYIPRHSGNLMLNLSYKGYYITYQHNSYSQRFTTTSNDYTTQRTIPSYFMNDISAGKEFKIKRIIFLTELKVFNILDEKYHTILYRPMPRRNYSLQLLVKI